MPESGPLGSVRGARGNLCPYRDLSFLVSMLEGCWVWVVLLLAPWGQEQSGQAMATTSASRSICR